MAETGLALADILRHSDPKRALEVFDHILRHLAEIPNNASFRRYEVNALARSSDPLRRVGRAAEGRRRLDSAFERLNQLKLYPAEKIRLGSEPEDALRALADYEAGIGNVPRAVEICDKLLDQIQAAKPNPETSLLDAVHLSNIYRQTAALHRRNGEADLASTLDARLLELWRHWDSKLPDNASVRRQLQAARLP